MKAPIYQRADMLHETLAAAVLILNEPVDGLLVTVDGVLVWTAARCILMGYRYDNSHDGNGFPMPGSGAWSAHYVKDCERPAQMSPAPAGVTGLLARVATVFGRSRR